MGLGPDAPHAKTGTARRGGPATDDGQGGPGSGKGTGPTLTRFPKARSLKPVRTIASLAPRLLKFRARKGAPRNPQLWGKSGWPWWLTEPTKETDHD